MDLNEARELRQELEAIEAAMERIETLWLSRDFPSQDDLNDIDKAVGGIAGTMDAIIKKEQEMPTANSFEDLGNAVRSIIGTMDAIIEKTDELPTADELHS